MVKEYTTSEVKKKIVRIWVHSGSPTLLLNSVKSLFRYISKIFYAKKHRIKIINVMVI